MSIELDPKLIEKWTKEGHWPPPDGGTVLVEAKPETEPVIQRMKVLINSLPPDKREGAQSALETLQFLKSQS